MKLLVLHRIPFSKVRYDDVIDHARHDVTYWGSAKSLENIPIDLRANRLVRHEGQDLGAMRGPYDRVIALSEYDLLDAARIREALGVEGPTVAQATVVRDKLTMKAVVDAAGIRIPRFCAMRDHEISGWCGPTVLKPRDGASSEGVHVFRSKKDAVQAATEGAVPDFDSERFELEEFIEGPIVHIDGIVVDGRVLCSVPSRYLGNCLLYAQGQPLGSVQLGDEDGAFGAWAQRCISAVGIDAGAFHLEAIESSDGLVFLEIGHRSGGADVVSTFEMATGVHLHTANLRVMLGEAVALPTRRSSMTFGWFVFPGHALGARVSRIEGVGDFLAMKQVVRWNQLEEGALLPKSITYQATDSPVAGVLCGATSQEVAEAMKLIFERVRVVGTDLVAVKTEPARERVAPGRLLAFLNPARA